MKGRVSFKVEFFGNLCSRRCKHLGNTEGWYECNLFGRELHAVGLNAVGGPFPVRLRACEQADFTSTVEVSDDRT